MDREPLTEAERLRIVHAMITQPTTEGGAGITPGKGEWSLVESIFPLHDVKFNKEWMKEWSTKWTVGHDDLKNLRDMFGEKVILLLVVGQQFLTLLLGRLLLRFPPSIFFVPHYCGCSWSRGLFLAPTILFSVCGCKLPLGCDFCRVLEEEGG